VDSFLPPTEFFARQVERLYNVPGGNMSLGLMRAWEGFGVISTGAELLAGIGYPQHLLLLRDATAIVPLATQALRRSASLPETGEIVVTARAAPPNDAHPSVVYAMHRGVYEVALALTTLLRKLARDSAMPADRRACREALAHGRLLADAYAVRPKGHLPDAAPHPLLLPARDSTEMTRMITEHADAVRAADPTDTREALTAAWYALGTAACLANFAASRDPRGTLLFETEAGAGIIAKVVEALGSAPSLPVDIHGVGLDTDAPSDAGRELVAIAVEGVRSLASASAAALDRAAAIARDAKDRAAATAASEAARELRRLYDQRLGMGWPRYRHSLCTDRLCTVEGISAWRARSISNV
jgi:hypothetical protein